MVNCVLCQAAVRVLWRCMAVMSEIKIDKNGIDTESLYLLETEVAKASEAIRELVICTRPVSFWHMEVIIR